MNGIKSLIIDLGGVIIGLTRNRCIDAFEQLGVKNVRENITNNFQHKDLFMQLELGYISVADFHDGIRQLAGKDLTDRQIDDAWIMMLGEVPKEKLELLLELRNCYNTILLSNTNEIHWKWIANNCFNYKNLKVDNFFHKIYLSYELHMLKPNTDIFEHVLNDAHIRSEETLLIDDSLPNCRTAEAMRMRAYNVQPKEDWGNLFLP